ncbi:hypothetical protein, partial [Methanothrix soehngenii]|uniref:hypothetical protein n=1 Tax=Methanothrix soehngenii TaxID=2223 RepID=UPI002C71E7C4
GLLRADGQELLRNRAGQAEILMNGLETPPFHHHISFAARIAQIISSKPKILPEPKRFIDRALKEQRLLWLN